MVLFAVHGGGGGGGEGGGGAIASAKQTKYKKKNRITNPIRNQRPGNQRQFKQFQGIYFLVLFIYLLNFFFSFSISKEKMK